MSDNNEEQRISEEFIADLKSRDARWNHIDTALKIEAELQNSIALQAVLEVVNERAIKALDEIVTVDPTDWKKIVGLQARIQCARIIGTTLEGLRRKGAIASQSLQDEEQLANDTTGGIDDGGR